MYIYELTISIEQLFIEFQSYVNFYFILYLVFSGYSNEGLCCRAMTADCLACASGMTVSEYCSHNSDTVGCEGE